MATKEKLNACHFVIDSTSKQLVSDDEIVGVNEASMSLVQIKVMLKYGGFVLPSL